MLPLDSTHLEENLTEGKMARKITKDLSHQVPMKNYGTRDKSGKNPDAQIQVAKREVSILILKGGWSNPSCSVYPYNSLL